MANIYILLDRSQSMINQWAEAIGAINGYVEELTPETRVFLAVFDSIGYDVLRNTTAQIWQPISPTEVMPRGGTPLYDASARIMHRAFDDNAEKTVLVTMTDGDENNSKKYTHSDIKLLSQQFAAKGWQEVFLGANFKNVDIVASSRGLAESKYMNMSTLNFVSTMKGFAGSTVAYASGTSDSIDFTAAAKADAVK
jgi:hypothetical protein